MSHSFATPWTIAHQAPLSMRFSQNLAKREDILIDSLKREGQILSARLAGKQIAGIEGGADAELLAMTCNGFRIYAFAFLFMGFAIFGSGFFTALNDGVTSAVISFLRTMVFQTSSVMLLPLIWGINGIWISVIVAEAMAVFVSLIFLKKKQKISLPQISKRRLFVCVQIHSH